MSYLFRLMGAALMAAAACLCSAGKAVSAPVLFEENGFRPLFDGGLAVTAPGRITWLWQAAFHPAIEFRGSYVCAQGLTALVLLVVDDHAVFNFSAHPANPGVPSGSLSMQGRVDLAGGIMHLEPVGWIVRPYDSWLLVGLEGMSTDHGRSFHGRVTGPPGCSGFSVKRVN
jgi:hypothetical protein